MFILPPTARLVVVIYHTLNPRSVTCDKRCCPTWLCIIDSVLLAGVQRLGAPGDTVRGEAAPLLAHRRAQGGLHLPAPQPGRPVQLDGIKPTLTAPGTECLTLKYDGPLSSFDFNFNLRR